MKSQKIVVALLSVLIAATFVNNQVQANDGVKDSVARSTTAHQTITGGSQQDFARFVQKAAPQLVANTTLESFLTVVNLYDNAPAQFLNANDKTRESFKANVKSLNETLSKSKAPGALNWLARVNYTANTIQFIWKYQASNLVPVVPVDEVSFN